MGAYIFVIGSVVVVAFLLAFIIWLAGLDGRLW